MSFIDLMVYRDFSACKIRIIYEIFLTSRNKKEKNVIFCIIKYIYIEFSKNKACSLLLVDLQIMCVYIVCNVDF